MAGNAAGIWHLLCSPMGMLPGDRAGFVPLGVAVTQQDPGTIPWMFWDAPDPPWVTDRESSTGHQLLRSRKAGAFNFPFSLGCGC